MNWTEEKQNGLPVKNVIRAINCIAEDSQKENRVLYMIGTKPIHVYVKSATSLKIMLTRQDVIMSATNRDVCLVFFYN